MMSCFIYLDNNQTPIGVQRFDSAPDVDIITPSNAVYILDSNTLPTDEEILTNWRVKNGILSNVGPNPGPNYHWDISQESWVPDIPKAKELKLKQINKIRNTKEFGGFTWNGLTFDSNSQSQIRIQGGVSLAQMAAANNQQFSIDWTLQDNTVTTLDSAQMIAVGLALANHVTGLHQISRTLKQQLNAATTLQEIEVIQWPV